MLMGNTPRVGRTILSFLKQTTEQYLSLQKKKISSLAKLAFIIFLYTGPYISLFQNLPIYVYLVPLYLVALAPWIMPMTCLILIFHFDPLTV